MDIYQTRRHNLHSLVHSRYGGVQSNLAAATSYSPNYISGLLTTGRHGKHLGEKVARKIEQICGLQEGWLDRPVESSELAQVLQSPVTSVVVPQSRAGWRGIPLLEKGAVNTSMSGAYLNAHRSGEVQSQQAYSEQAFAVQHTPGDTVVVDPSVEPSPGDSVLVMVGDQLVIYDSSVKVLGVIVERHLYRPQT